MVGDPVLVVTRETIKNGVNLYGRKVVLGVCSSLEGAWRLIASDYRLLVDKGPCKFIDAAPWGGVYNIMEVYEDTARIEYQIDATHIDLFAD